MFTGIIEACLPIRRASPSGTGLRVELAVPEGWPVRPGESIAICGVCLTALEGAEQGLLAFDLSAETLGRTWFGELEPGRRVNLERAMRLGDRLDGHLVAGHVDGGGTIVAIEDSGDGGQLLRVELDPGLERYLIEKGSITLDGISLTVVEPHGLRFDVAIIPITLERTNLGQARVGQRVNVEADMVGKWIEKLCPR